jgi:hypothetical protein
LGKEEALKYFAIFMAIGGFSLVAVGLYERGASSLYTIAGIAIVIMGYIAYKLSD